MMPRFLAWLSAGTLFAAALSAQCGYSPTNLILPDTSYPLNSYNSGTTSYQATNTITAAGGAGSFNVGGTATVTFQAGTSITLLPGFTANGASGSPTFHATIGPVAQYLLTTAVSPSSTGSISASPCSTSGYYSAGTVVYLTATPNGGYVFVNWSNGSTANPLYVTMSAAMSLTANFSASLVPETITTNPTGLSITVDGTAYTTPHMFQWQPGSAHTIATSSPQSAYGTQPNPQQYMFANWSDGGAISHTIYASASTDAATFATIAGPSSLEVNLSFMSFGYYDLDPNHPASSRGFSQSCPLGSTVRGCFQTILGNLRQQGVSGVRIFVPLCEFDDSISALTGCGQQSQNVYFDSSSGKGHTWVTNAGAFFSDLNSAHIQNVTITIAHGTPAGSPTNDDGSYGFKVPIEMTTNPRNQNCQNGSSTVWFWPGLPYGLTWTAAGGFEIFGKDEPLSQGYNCAPSNPYFIGWTNQFNAIDALLGAAQGKVTVSELDFEQELNMLDYTALLRFIYDNAQTNTYNGAYPGCSTSPVDVVCALRTLMTNHTFDPGRVTWSIPHWDFAPADASCPSVDPTTGTCNCIDIYTDWARLINLDAVASAFGGGYVGKPADIVPSSGWWCGGTDINTMLQVPISHTQPNIVDAHIYPHVVGAGSGDTKVQQVATLDFSNLTHFLSLVYPSGPTPTMMIGETHLGTSFIGFDLGGDPCPGNGYPQYAAASTVAGFNQSQLAGYPIIFRPWMEVEDPQGTCYPYSTYQNVNLNWGGPYAPTQY